MLLHAAGHTCGRLPAPTSTQVSTCTLSHTGCRGRCRDSFQHCTASLQLRSIKPPVHRRDRTLLFVTDHLSYSKVVGSSALDQQRPVQTVSGKTQGRVLARYLSCLPLCPDGVPYNAAPGAPTKSVSGTRIKDPRIKDLGPDNWNITYYPKQHDTVAVHKPWYIIDAEGQTLGRLAVLAACVLRYMSGLCLYMQACCDQKLH